MQSESQLRDFHKISYSLVVVQILNVDAYSYVSYYYFLSMLPSTYKNYVQLIIVYLNWRVEDDYIIALPSLFKCSTRRSRKQRISSIGEVKRSLSKCVVVIISNVTIPKLVYFVKLINGLIIIVAFFSYIILYRGMN